MQTKQEKKDRQRLGWPSLDPIDSRELEEAGQTLQRLRERIRKDLDERAARER